MTDWVVEAIANGAMKTSSVTFENLRRLAVSKLKDDANIYDWRTELDRGRTILKSPVQLDQYLWTYGRMIEAQWSALLQDVSLPQARFHVRDYGCGQGLGTMLALEAGGNKLIQMIDGITLIEPSQVALIRAMKLVACYVGNCPITAINKCLDDLDADDIYPSPGDHQLHILSNVLDIGTFDHRRLFSEMFRVSGKHTVLVVSHDRDFHGGSSRFNQLEEAVHGEEHLNWFTVQSSEVKYFDANGKTAVSWQLHIEVLNGSL